MLSLNTYTLPILSDNSNLGGGKNLPFIHIQDQTQGGAIVPLDVKRSKVIIEASGTQLAGAEPCVRIGGENKANPASLDTPVMH